MKKWFGFLSLMLLLAVLVAPALAQQSLLTANVPFAFTVDGKVLPAGSYVVKESHPGLYLVQGDSGAAFIMGIPENWSAPSHPKLVFQRYGDTYVLSQFATTDERWDVPIGHSAAKMAKNGAPVEIGAVTGN